MSHPSVSTEPASADPETPPADSSVRAGKGSRDNKARMVALGVGMLVGTLVGMFVGIRIGNATRKWIDRLGHAY